MAETKVCSIHGTVMTLGPVVGGSSYPRRAEWHCASGHTEPAPGLLPPTTSTQLLVCGILLTPAGLAALAYGIFSGSASALLMIVLGVVFTVGGIVALRVSRASR